MIIFCIGTKQSHDTRYTDCTRNEAAVTSPWTPAPNWASFCASSSGGSKNKSLIWRRTDEVDWTLQIKHCAAFWLDKQHNFRRITSWNCFPFHMLHGDLETQQVLVEGRNDWSSMTQPYHTLSLLGGAEFVDLDQSSAPSALTTAAWLSKRLLWWWQSSC